MLKILQIDHLLGWYRSWRGDYRGAVPHFDRIYRRDPGNARTRQKLVSMLYKSRQYLKILEVSYPGGGQLLAPDLAHKALLSLFALQRYEELGQRFRELGGAAQSVSSVQVVYADSLVALGSYQEARAIYQSLLNGALAVKDISALSGIYHMLGYIDELSGDSVNAEEWYRKAIEISSLTDAKKLGIAVLHFKKGLLDQAALAGQAAIEDGTGSPDLHYLMGEIYSAQLQTAKATKAYKAFVESDLDRPVMDENQVIFDAYMGRNYACSPRAIYEAMLKDKAFRRYSFVWVVGSSSLTRYWRLYLSPRTRLVRYKSKDYFRCYAQSRYWVSNSRISFVHKTDPRQVYVQCWHGTPLKKIGHSLILNTESARYTKESVIEQYDFEARRFDYLVSPSRAASHYLAEAFDLARLGNMGALIETGYPRNDMLKNRGRAHAFRIRTRLGLPRGKKVLLYAPTWRDDQHSRESGYRLKIEIDFERLRAELADDWVILFRAHYFVANNFNFDAFKGFIYNVSGVNDINDLYIASDALMTDYSSVFFDFANLGRPILFYMYDLEHYERDLRGFYFGLDTLPGRIFQKEDEVIDVLADLGQYSDDCAMRYQAFNQKYNYLDDGNAATRVIKAVWKEAAP